MRSFFRAALAALTVVAFAAPVEHARAQGSGKALVYCPVGIDDAGCNAIVNALSAQYLAGVDKGYDGSGGTINLATADLGVYSVFVVPSLADDANAAPYGMLRDPAIAHRLHDVLLGRIALWSGTPDIGSANRAEKDALIRSLASWSSANFATVNGPGLVVLLDQSQNAIQRYDWLQGLVGLNVLADTEVNVYGSVRTLDAAGAAILAPGGVATTFANMATFGFYLPVGAAGVSLSAVGQTGTAVGGQVVLITSPGGNVGTAAIQTDKDDYAPGEFVTFTGTGFQAGESVTITLHEDPRIDADQTLSAVADGTGRFTHNTWAPDAHDLDVRFIVTALGAAGSRAQTTFTDGTINNNVTVSPASLTVTAGSSASYTVTVSFVGNNTPCTAGLSVTAGLPTGATGTFPPPGSVTGAANNTPKSATLTITTTSSGPSATPPGTYNFTVTAAAGSGCSGQSRTGTGTLVVNAAANTAPVLAPIGNKTVNELETLTFTASATDAQTPTQTLTYSLVGAPAGATINATTGEFSWMPTEAQGPGDYPFTVKVTDNGSPAMSDEEAISVHVNEVNLPPVLASIGPKTVNEESALTFTASATDPDFPVNTLAFSLVGAPAGATINATTGAFSWTPTEAQGPGPFTFTVKVTDNGTPNLSDEEAITVTVNEVNVAPVLAPIGPKTVNEGAALSFTATATDADVPANTLVFSLDAGSPAGAAITPAGAFTWTPTEAQGPGSFPITIRVTDNGVPVLDDFETITVTVNEVNEAPILAPIGPKTVNEETALTFTATATDPDVPANTLTFSLVGAPAGATIDGSTGAFSWTPTEAQGPGPYTFTVKVADNGTPSLSDEEAITVTVNEVNAAPVLAPIGPKTVNESALLSFTATATDADVPANTLVFSLDAGSPAGAAITPAGAFTWTPTEAQGPGSYPITIRVTDNGTPVLDDFEIITVTVNEVNEAPVLAPIGNQTVNEETPLTFTASATDPDVPANTLAFSLVGAPAGATINPTTGAFSWTPTEAQGPGTHTFTVKVTDDGTPNLSDEEAITVTVNEVNKAPVLATIGPKSVDEETALTFTASATDPDLPANTLTYSLDAGFPVGATINPTTGAFSWTPTEAQGPGSYPITIRVTDNGSPVLDDFETITVTVNEVNLPPVLAAIGNHTLNEETPLTFTASATDPDVPPNTLAFSLVGAPAGATINPTTGAFSWTPTEAQGPGTHTFTVKVTDNGTPNLSDEEAITVTVNEVNLAPVLAPIGNQTVNEETALTFTASAADPDLPPNTLTYSLDAGFPTGATINPTTGAFSWTPTEAQGPGSYPITIRVTDNGSPVLDDFETITVTVNEVNLPPVLAPIGNHTLNEETLLTFTASATDPDVPPNTLAFSLVGAPAGATINPTTGAFSWTPTEAQGPGTHTFTVKVTDNGTPNLSDEEAITVTVNEVNLAPVLAGIGNQTVNEETALTFTASATDPDLPPNTLTFSLDAGFPVGATINPTTGAFSWTPTEAQGPGSYPITIRVTDNGSPVLDDFETITVTVNEVNVAPVLAMIGNKTIDEETELTFTASATDADVPANTLAFSLVGAPAGATINPTTGAFSWTPTEAQGPGPYTFKVKVTDNGTPVLFDEEEITVTVNEVNLAPVLAGIGNKTVDEETALTFTATATDPDLPPNTLTFSLVGAPVGAAITSGGAFSWTPTEAQGPGTYTFTVKVTDDGTPNLSDEEAITVTVNEVNRAPVLATIGPKSVDEETPLTFTASATDPDLPPNTLTFSLVGAPVGATITSGGAFSWTPTEAQGPGTYTFTVKVTDDGTPNLSDEEAITVTVNEVNLAPVLAPISNQTVNEETELTFTASATDPDLPPNTLAFSLVGAPAGATINPTTGAFSWTPTEAQGPGVYTFTVKVTDNGTPNLSDEQAITVTVNEVNLPPVLASIGDKTVNEETPLTFTASATDPDLPPNTLTFSLDAGFPVGATINPTTGAFSWTPTEAQGPGTYPITIRVTDNGSPVLDDFEAITVTVNEVNLPPVLAPIGDKIVNEEAPLTFTASATDPDLPPNTLTFSLDAGFPAGATINSTTGAFSWTPTEAQGPGSYPITIRVTDNGVPVLNDFETITVTVNEVNLPPVLASIGDKTVNEETPLTFTASATDPDLPPNTLTFSLDAGFPVGATINASTGAFSWTPTEAQGPGSYPITIRVTDNGVPVLDDFETITVTVNEVNLPPVLASIGDKTVNEETPLTFTASATDPDLPPNTLTFSLDAGFPVGATINPTTGAFSWTPTEAQGPGTYPITIRVTDNGSPVLDDFEAITVTVNEVNLPPVLAPIGDKTVNEEAPLTFTASATDPDLPPNTLTFSLDVGAPAGATINSTTGAFSWTPTEAQGPGTYPITIRVTDNGVPVLDDFETITVTVNEVNKPPVLAAIGNKSVNEGSTLTFTASATDPDLPANTLAFSLVGGPAGATINAVTGAFSWTPTDGPSQTATFTVKVTDDGSPLLSDEEQITVTVNNVAPTATFNAPSSVPEGTPIALSLTSPSDPSSNDTGAGFTYAFDCGAGAGYGAYGASYSTTCPTPDNGTRTVGGKIKDKDNGETEYTQSVTVTNAAPNITSVTAEPTSPGNVYSVDQNVTIKALFTDAGSADTHTCVATAVGLSGATKTGSTGTGSSASGMCSSTIDFTVADVYTVTITVKDDDLQTDSETIQVVVYDPSAGFVTGGGWIMAAPGSYVADASLSGKGTFGFVSKYQKGSNVPEGNTQFTFHAAGFNFHSVAYQFLIVNQNGTNAQFRGTGTVNGATGYSFMLWATDDTPDKFRIKVWHTTTNVVVFDNLLGHADGVLPQAISNGSIQIHAPKK